MPSLNGALFLAGACLALFGYWGLYTCAGHNAFRGMAGMVPFWAGVAGSILMCLALLLFALQALFCPKTADTLLPDDRSSFVSWSHLVLPVVPMAIALFFETPCRRAIHDDLSILPKNFS